MKKLKFLDIFNIVYIVCIVLMIMGFLPRSVSLVAGLGALIYVLWAPIEDGVIFFVRTIPFFVALPLTRDFDSLNLWRIVSAVIFLKWITWDYVKTFFKFEKKLNIKNTLLLLLVIAVISSVVAISPILSIKRIIFLVNLSLIGVVIHDLVSRNQDFQKRIIRNIAVPVILVAVAGLVQLVNVYYWNINRFADYWAGVVDFNLYGHAWAETAIKANTWFAYFGNQLSLRMFSIFPDSHSFPIFLLLGLPSIFVLSIKRPWEKSESLKKMFHTRGSLWVVMVPLIFLEIILTGTRGMWLASVPAVLAILVLIYFLMKDKVTKEKKNLVKYVGSFMSIFFMMFAVSFPIFSSPQFLLEKGDSALFGRRIISVINTGEVSNARRLEIWHDSWRSILNHPLIGVGINNFPVVVHEDLSKIKAGSSAHNLYLHIAAEMGIPALLLSLYFLYLIFQKIYRKYLAGQDYETQVFAVVSIISLVWVFCYLMTDIAIFDERAFLLFATVVSIFI